MLQQRADYLPTMPMQEVENEKDPKIYLKDSCE